MNDAIKVMLNDAEVGSVDSTQWRQATDQPVVVRLHDGRELVAERTYFRSAADGSLMLQTKSAGGSNAAHGAAETTTSANAGAGSERLVIPLMAERLEVSKREVESGRVRITKTVREETQTIERPLMKERVNVDRVEINRFVDGPMPVRHEGDVMIVPVLEEVLVIETRLMLKEELRITKHAIEVNEPQTATVRIEEARVERVATHKE
jgi:uncharacterized protein (TIGR02271 family)